MESRAMNSGIYLVTDPPMSMARIGESEPQLSSDKKWHTRAIEETLALCVSAREKGIRLFQLRWKNVDAKFFLDLAMEVSDAIGDDAQIIINDRIDVFLAARKRGAKLAGIHIGQTDLPAQDVRTMIGPDALIGISAHTDATINAAEHLRYTPSDAHDKNERYVIDSIGVGVLHETSTKLHTSRPLGFEGISRIANTSHLPVTAIGGIHTSDIPQLASSRIHNAAVVSAIVAAQNPGQVAQEMVELWNAHRKVPAHE